MYILYRYLDPLGMKSLHDVLSLPGLCTRRVLLLCWKRLLTHIRFTELRKHANPINAYLLDWSQLVHETCLRLMRARPMMAKPSLAR